MAGLLIRGVDGGRDVRIEGSRIAEVAPAIRPHSGDDVIDAHGGALLPGLHDHHLHLHAMAAAVSSVDCRGDRAALTAALAEAATGPDGWVRGVGWDDWLAGDLDRASLDAVTGAQPRFPPVRIQHRSGHLWVVNRAGAERLGLPPDHDGRLFASGHGQQQPANWGDFASYSNSNLPQIGRQLAGYGVTAVTDATPGQHEIDRSALPQRVHLLGASKMVLAEHDLPDLDSLAGSMRDIHAGGRPVAVHCASRATLVLALSAFEAAGPVAGDRVEHASVAPPELVDWLARLGLTVVTQPAFPAVFRARYRATVDAEDLPWLWRLRGFLAAGIRVRGSSDAPFGPADPWLAIRAAVDRDDGEALTPEEALVLYTDRAHPSPGTEADLCLLRTSWAEARTGLHAGLVAATVIGGRAVHVP